MICPEHTEFKDLLKKMLTLNPKRRISCEEALKHGFFNVSYKDFSWGAPFLQNWPPEQVLINCRNIVLLSFFFFALNLTYIFKFPHMLPFRRYS